MKIPEEFYGITAFACFMFVFLGMNAAIASTDAPPMALDLVSLVHLLFNTETAGKIVTTLSISIAVLAQLRALLPTLLIKKFPKSLVVLVDWLVGNYGASQNKY